MKRIKDKEIGIEKEIPETPLEAVEQLEEFLLADFSDSKDYIKHFPKLLKEHFKICKEQIKSMVKRWGRTY